MQERRADEVLVLDGEAIWSRAIQETFNRLDKAVGSLLDGSQPACFPIENQHLQWGVVVASAVSRPGLGAESSVWSCRAFAHLACAARLARVWTSMSYHAAT